MTESDITRILVALARVEVDVKAIRADNARGEHEHEDFELRLRALEKFRWLLVGTFTLAGSGVGALIGKWMG